MPLRNYRAPEEGQTRGGAGPAVIRMSTKRMMTTTGITNWLLSSAWPASPTLNGNASFASLRSEKQVTIASRAAHVLFSVDLRPEGCATKSTSKKRTHCKWRTRQQLGSTWADFGALFKHIITTADNSIPSSVTVLAHTIILFFGLAIHLRNFITLYHLISITYGPGPRFEHLSLHLCALSNCPTGRILPVGQPPGHSIVRWCLSPERNLTRNLFFLFPIVFGINLIHFFGERKDRSVENSIAFFGASIPCHAIWQR